nr:hypothetical protein OH837_41570 [Streptomyces canus]
MVLFISASLDTLTAGGIGSAVARWFRAALVGPLSGLLQAEEQGGQVYSLASTQRDESSRDRDYSPISQNWSLMERELSEAPETGDLLFFEEGGDGPTSHVKSSSITVRRPNMSLSVLLEVRDGELADPGYCSGITDFLVASLNDVNPAFARVDVTGPSTDRSNLDVVLGRRPRHSVNEARLFLRGYSWITVCPDELCRRLGGVSGLAASGAFCRVIPLAAGGAVLQSTETLTGFSDDAMRDVFRVLAPVLPAGMPRFDPAHPEVRYVPEDASAM